MPIRFSTQAANADHMRMDAEPGAAEALPDAVGADGAPRDRANQDKDAAAKPGKDINAPGFIKEEDAGKP